MPYPTQAGDGLKAHAQSRAAGMPNMGSLVTLGTK